MSVREFIERVEALAEDVPHGPWESKAECYCATHENAMETGGCEHEPWQYSIRVPGTGTCVSYEAGIVHLYQGERMAEFIAASRAVVPQLTAALRAVLDVCAEAEPWSEPLAERVIDHINEALDEGGAP